MEYKLVQYHSPSELNQEKENDYLEVRRKEGRILPDEVVKNLPHIPAFSPYALEWKWRERSFHRFLRRLPQHAVLRILDLGCGNGWMANRLAENPNWTVWAVDLNREELEQGARLFGRENLQFIYADVLQGVLPEKQFDVVVLAGAVQYFPDLKALLIVLHKLLKTNGEIHILDTPFYKNDSEKMAARQRTMAYYSEIGAPQMAKHYHHHLWVVAETLGAKNLNRSLKIRFLQQIKWLGPFPWLLFRQKLY